MLTMERADGVAPTRGETTSPHTPSDWPSDDPSGDDVLALVRRHVPLVEHIVTRVSRRFPSGFDRDELVQVAMVGLVEAAGRFDPERGASFSTFAGRRIEGAILDSARKTCWAPRSVRSNQRAIEAAEGRLRTRLHRGVSESEVAGELGVDVAQLARWRASVLKSRLVSLEGDRFGGVRETLADPQACIEELVERRDLRDRIRRSLSALSERHRYVVVGHLLEDRPMHELADDLGITRSRASQLKAEAIQRLRLAMESHPLTRSAATRTVA